VKSDEEASTELLTGSVVSEAAPGRVVRNFPEKFPPRWACSWGEDLYGVFAGFSYGGVAQRFRWIEPGEFMMGKEDETQHHVSLSQGFWLADTTCTQQLWVKVNGKNPSQFESSGDQAPVDSVSFNDVEEFIKLLNTNHGAAEHFRLPTEAEWEYACRAGTTTRYSFGDTLDEKQANFRNVKGHTVPVKEYPCNPWGLYQMHGNVWEWCSDWYGDYSSGAVVDPTGPKRGVLRVLRGGSWYLDAGYCRSALRGRNHPDGRSERYGFRLARGP
jgi:formylglycine-generating enzyme required for sulfatase activity